MSRFPFAKKEEGKSKRPTRTEAAESAATEVQNALDSARKLLETDQCKAYVKDFRKAERAAINKLMEMNRNEHDMVKFAHNAKQILTKIETLRILIDAVHGSAGDTYE